MQALDPEQDSRTAAVIQENFEEEIYQDQDDACVYRRARKAKGTLGCICAIQVFRDWASEGAVGQKKCLEESVPSHSRARRLQACNTQMGEDGVGSA